MRIWAVLVLLLRCLLPSVCAQEIYSPISEEEYALYKEALGEELASEADRWMEEGTADAVSVDLLFSRIVSKIRSSLGISWPSAARLMTSLMGLLMLSAMLTGCGSGLLGSSLSPAWELCTTLCISLTAAQALRERIAVSEEYLQNLATLVNGVTPTVCAITAASGHLSTAAAGHASLMLVYTLLQNVYAFFLFPAVKLSFCFGILGGISSSVRIDALARLVRRLFLWILGLLGILLGFMTGAQSWIARGADSLTMRTVKFALSSFIPLVGSSLSEALGTAAGSLRLIRQSCGLLSTAAVLLYLIPAAAELLLHRLVLSLCQGAAEIIGCEREGKLLGEMHGILGYMLAVVTVSSLLFLFVLTRMIGVAESGG